MVVKVFLLTMALMVFLGSPAAEAARFTGSYLLQVCEKDAQGRETVPGGHATCQSYISGVIDYHNVLRSLRIAPEIDICIPQSVTLHQIHDIVLVFLRRSPEHDVFVAAPAVTMALYDVFPCR